MAQADQANKVVRAVQAVQAIQVQNEVLFEINLLLCDRLYGFYLAVLVANSSPIFIKIILQIIG